MNERESSQKRHESPYPESQTLLDPDQNRTLHRPIWTPIAILIAIGLILSIAFGFLQKENFDDLRLDFVTKNQRQSAVLVDGNEETTVMMIRTDGVQEVRIINTDTYVVEDASRGMKNISQPVLSNSGKRLAYFTTRKESIELDIYEIGGTSAIFLPARELSVLASQMDSDRLEICPWSPLDWSETDRYLAFLVCSDSFSFLAVKNLNTDELKILELTKANKDYSRTFLWLSDTQLILVQPGESRDTVWLVDTISEQKDKVFGP